MGTPGWELSWIELETLLDKPFRPGEVSAKKKLSKAAGGREK